MHVLKLFLKNKRVSNFVQGLRQIPDQVLHMLNTNTVGGKRVLGDVTYTKEIRVL